MRGLLSRKGEFKPVSSCSPQPISNQSMLPMTELLSDIGRELGQFGLLPDVVGCSSVIHE